MNFTIISIIFFGDPFDSLPLLSDNKGDTVIGNDVWIGYNVTIMPGVVVGDGAIIASKSIITKNIEPYTIVGGNPAKPIRQRFTQDVVDTLLALKWWDWDLKTIAKHATILLNNDLAQLQKLFPAQFGNLIKNKN